MIAVMLMCVALIAGLCVLAYALAVYAFPFMPAVVAGYALVHGVTREAAPSEIWRQIFCIIGGGFAGVSALLRLAAPMNGWPT